MTNSTSPWFLIANPKAGGGKAQKDWNKIQRTLDTVGLGYDCVWTERPFHAIDLVRSALEKGYRKFAALGGDGTVNEVINGIFSQQLVPSRELLFGVLPIGTGNDWARTYRIPKAYAKSIPLLKKAKSRVQDIGKVTYNRDGVSHTRFFNNVLGLCFDAFVADQTKDQSKSGLKGQLFYLLGVLKCLGKYSCPTLHVQGEGIDFHGPAILANVGLCRFSGGGMQLVPQAIPGDGLFDITIVEALTPAQVYRRLPLLYNGKLYKDSHVHHFRSSWVTVSATPDSLLEVDGENLGEIPASIDLLPAALNVVCNVE
ncbi:MAG: diacylglycerol kinase family protein [Bacteroidota bacterium]